MTEKKQVRAACLAARRAMTDGERAEKSAQISEKLAQNGTLLGVKTVLSYLAAADEVDLSAFHTWAKERGICVAYPVSKRGGLMEAAVPADDTALVTGLFGIRAPAAERSQTVAPQEIDVVIVPCVGFDRRGHRLGHGGGYYDRYLPCCINAHTILVAFAEQEVAEVPVEAHDMTMDEVITA